MNVVLLRMVHVVNTCLNFLVPSSNLKQLYDLRETQRIKARLRNLFTQSTGDLMHPENRYNISPFRGDYKRLFIHDLKTNLAWVEDFDSEIDAGNHCLNIYSSEHFEGALERSKAPNQLIRLSTATSEVTPRPRPSNS